jgi:hypothetical protein
MPSRGRYGPTSKRLALAKRVRVLTEVEGRTAAEAGAILGISRGYAAALRTDPDGEKERARKDSYRKPCPDCGELMSGQDGPNHPPAHCANCAPNHVVTIWPPEEIIAAFKKFYELMGRTPAVTDTGIGLTPSVIGKLSPERVAEARESTRRVPLPRPSFVYRHFGTWQAAQDAAGVPRSQSGGPAHRGPPRMRGRDVELVTAIAHGAETIPALSEATSRTVPSLRVSVRRLVRQGLLVNLNPGRDFPGRYVVTNNEGEKMSTRPYVVLHRNGDESWTVHPTAAHSSDLAIEKIANGTDGDAGLGEGEYVALGEGQWDIRIVGPTTRLVVTRN